MVDNLSKKIIEKIKCNIQNNNNKDLNRFKTRGTLTFDEYIEKIKNQAGKCWVCKQDFRYDGGKWCYFFPSADRIDNNKPHNKENILISCLFCNIRCFKQVNEKKCGLCDGLNHSFEGEIITKSELFRCLGHSEYRLMKYLEDLYVKPKQESPEMISLTL